MKTVVLLKIRVFFLFEIKILQTFEKKFKINIPKVKTFLQFVIKVFLKIMKFL